MKPERMNEGEKIKQIENKREMPFGLVRAGEISGATESYICPAVGECCGH